MTVLSAPRLLVDGVLTGPGAVRVEAGRVVDVTMGRPSPGADHVELEHGILTAGMVDLQVNGAFGVDLATATADQWHTVAARLAGTGVTAFLPTFVTAPVEDVLASLVRTAAARLAVHGEPVAQVLGGHLEGPFLSPEHAGAHDPALMVDPTPERVDALLSRTEGTRVLTMVTLAPEREHGLDAVRRLAAAGVVVSIGHSDATADQTSAAADAGARMVTHVFNAQRGLHHREPGVAGQALVDDRLTVGLIADLVHVHPSVVRLVVQAAPGRVVLVTDAVAAAGTASGSYELGGVGLHVGADDGAPRRADGTLAGSTLELDAAVRNVVSTGVPPAVALDAATRVPAAVLGRHDIGCLAPGARADLVWWDDDLHLLRAWVGGVQVGGSQDG